MEHKSLSPLCIHYVTKPPKADLMTLICTSNYAPSVDHKARVSMISLLLHKSEMKLRMSVNNKDIIRMCS